MAISLLFTEPLENVGMIFSTDQMPFSSPQQQPPQRQQLQSRSGNDSPTKRK